jgi:tetratricopeptide (TPR) repeat protein
MKQAFTILLAMLSLTSIGQTPTDTTGMKMFSRGLDFYNKGNLDSALAIWTEIVDKKIGLHYDTYGNAFFNIPTIYWQLKEYQKAKEWYIKVLESDLRDNDETGSLMEPHTNYKHKSAIALAGLSQLDSNYAEVLQWLIKADTLYKYWGFEGSATNVSEEQAYLLHWKINVLLKLNRREEAIRATLIELICSRNLEDFFSKSEDTLLTLVDKKQFKLEIDSSMHNLAIQTIDDKNWTASFYLHGLEYKIPISKAYPDKNLPHYWTIYFVNKDQTVDNKNVVEYIEQRNFYRRLIK